MVKGNKEMNTAKNVKINWSEKALNVGILRKPTVLVKKKEKKGDPKQTVLVTYMVTIG